MRKLSGKIASCLLAAAMLLPFGAPQAEATSATVPDTIRIGLAYGSGAMPGANLENSVGSGYRLGYTTDGLNFTQLGYTAETKISVVKTQNVAYNGKNYVDSASGAAVGCYHMQLPTAYGSFDEASAAATQAGGFPAWISGTYYVRVGSYPSSDEASAALASSGLSGATVAGTSSGGMSVVKTGTSTILFQFDTGASSSMFMINPGLDDSQKNATWFAGYKYYGMLRYQRPSGGNIAVVNVLGREDYINCVISQEMGNNWPVEALKAQALCARSYAAVCANRHTGDGFDLCATVHCQAYPGMGQITANTTQAATETAGQYIWYNGSIAQTYYFSSDGGATEDSKNVWGGSIPYLKGVVDPWEATVQSKISGYNWSVTFTKAELEQKLQGKGYTSITNLVNVTVNPSPTGNAKSVTFTDASGQTQTIFGESARLFIKPSYGSQRFTVTADGSGGGSGYYVNGGSTTIPSVSGAYAVDGSGSVSQVGDGAYVITGTGTEQLGGDSGSTGTGGVPSSYTFNGSGWGHNVGMSQWGAYAMAQAGKTYRDILTFYFTGIEVR